MARFACRPAAETVVAEQPELALDAADLAEHLSRLLLTERRGECKH